MSTARGSSEIRYWNEVSSVRGFVETCLPHQICPPLGVWLSSPHPWPDIVSICRGRVGQPCQSVCPFSGVQFTGNREEGTGNRERGNRERGHRAPGKQSGGLHGRFARRPLGVVARGSPSLRDGAQCAGIGRARLAGPGEQERRMPPVYRDTYLPWRDE